MGSMVRNICGVWNRRRKVLDWSISSCVCTIAHLQDCTIGILRKLVELQLAAN